MNRFKQAFGQISFWVVFSFLHVLLGILLVGVLLPCSRTAGKAAVTDREKATAGDPAYKRRHHFGIQRLPLTRNFSLH